MLVDFDYKLLYISLDFVFNSLPEDCVSLNIFLYKSHCFFNILSSQDLS